MFVNNDSENFTLPNRPAAVPDFSFREDSGFVLVFVGFVADDCVGFPGSADGVEDGIFFDDPDKEAVVLDASVGHFEVSCVFESDCGHDGDAVPVVAGLLEEHSLLLIVAHEHMAGIKL